MESFAVQKKSTHCRRTKRRSLGTLKNQRPQFISFCKKVGKKQRKKKRGEKEKGGTCAGTSKSRPPSAESPAGRKNVCHYQRRRSKRGKAGGKESAKTGEKKRKSLEKNFSRGGNQDCRRQGAFPNLYVRGQRRAAEQRKKKTPNGEGKRQQDL